MVPTCVSLAPPRSHLVLSSPVTTPDLPQAHAGHAHQPQPDCHEQPQAAQAEKHHHDANPEPFRFERHAPASRPRHDARRETGPVRLVGQRHPVPNHKEAVGADRGKLPAAYRLEVPRQVNRRVSGTTHRARHPHKHQHSIRGQPISRINPVHRRLPFRRRPLHPSRPLRLVLRLRPLVCRPIHRHVPPPLLGVIHPQPVAVGLGDAA